MISLDWVSDYIDIKNEDYKKLAEKITKAGINIERIVSNHIDNLVIGQIISCENHPDSDHLHVCQVKINDHDIVQIVCGAKNVRPNLKVVVSLPGAILPGNNEIKKSTIRGVESNGMMCALFELGLVPKTDEEYAKGIFEAPNDAPVGADAMKYLGYDDTLYELDIHKHRNNDCYYHIGFAYEIAAILNKKVHLPEADYHEINESIKDYIKLEVKTSKCPYYSAKMVKDITIKESPKFIQKRLEAAGMRSINNVVDISNYVMLEYGQPLHFFDQDKLGGHILVRDAKDNEEIITLDNKKRILKSSDIVITNGEKPVCIAGVMGGLNTDVDNTTKNILIESAIFDAISIRYTASNLDLKSEASIRYGKGLDYEYTKKALDRACYLLEKYADAKILKDEIIYDHIDKKEKQVEFTSSEINQMLGIKISNADMAYELNRLDFPFTEKDDYFKVTIPLRRLDVDPNINDIAEEIGRLYGYANLESTLPVVPIKKGEYIGDVKYYKFASKRLRMLGLNETKTYTLVAPNMAKIFNYENKVQINLPNPMSADKSVIRTTLISSLINVYNYNKARKVNDVMLYEISKTYDINYNEDTKIAILMKGNYIDNEWHHMVIKTDFYLIKGVIENLLKSMGLQNRYSFKKEVICDLHPGICARILLDNKEVGIIGRVHPNLLKDDVYVAEISLSKLIVPVKPIKYHEALKYPTIEKDVAFIVNKIVSSAEIISEIKKAGSRLLQDINVFDVYEDCESINTKSIAFHLTFADANRTLTDEEVMTLFNKIIDEVRIKFNATLRDK